MRRPIVLAAIPVALVLLLAGCGDDESVDATGATTSAPTSTVAASTTGAPSSNPASTVAAGTDTGATGSGGTAGSPTTAAAPSGPVFASFSVQADDCPTGPAAAPDVSVTSAPYDGKVFVSWKVTGPYDEIYTAVDNPDGAYASGLPSSGRQEFTRQCGSAHTYYVVAVSNGKKTVKSQAVAAG